MPPVSSIGTLSGREAKRFQYRWIRVLQPVPWVSEKSIESEKRRKVSIASAKLTMTSSLWLAAARKGVLCVFLAMGLFEIEQSHNYNNVLQSFTSLSAPALMRILQICNMSCCSKLNTVSVLVQNQINANQVTCKAVLPVESISSLMRDPVPGEFGRQEDYLLYRIRI